MRLFAHWPAKAASLIVAVMIVILNRNITQSSYYFSVPLTVAFHSAMLPLESYPEEVSIRIRGKKEALEGISRSMFRAVADFSRYGRRGGYEAPIDIQRMGPALRVNPIEIQVEPKKLQLSIEQKISRTVPIQINTTGFPPAGYEVTRTQVLPSSILIEGPITRVELLESVETEEILLQNQTLSFTSRVRINSSDASIQFPMGEYVEFRAFIEETDVLDTFESINIIVLDLSSSLELASPLPDGLINVQGNVRDLEQMSAEDIQFTVDASTISRPGRYELSPEPIVPPNLTILQYEPNKVILEVRRKEEE